MINQLRDCIPYFRKSFEMKVLGSFCATGIAQQLSAIDVAWVLEKQKLQSETTKSLKGSLNAWALLQSYYILLAAIAKQVMTSCWKLEIIVQITWDLLIRLVVNVGQLNYQHKHITIGNCIDKSKLIKVIQVITHIYCNYNIMEFILLYLINNIIIMCSFNNEGWFTGGVVFLPH